MKKISIALALLFVCVFACSAHAKDEAAAAPKFEPTKTIVAIIPVVNESGKDDDQALKLCTVGTSACEEQFTSHGFQLVAQSAIAKALADNKIDLTDEENRGKDTMSVVGKAVSADIVMMAVLKPTKDRVRMGLITARKSKEAVIDMKLLDVSDATYIMNAVYKGTGKGSGFADFSSSSSLREVAVKGAVTNAFKDFMKPYKDANTDKGGGDTPK
jgi:hypothetical protein